MMASCDRPPRVSHKSDESPRPEGGKECAVLSRIRAAERSVGIYAEINDLGRAAENVQLSKETCVAPGTATEDSR